MDPFTQSRELLYFLAAHTGQEAVRYIREEMRQTAPGRIPTAWELRSYFQFPDRPTALTAWQQILAVDKLLEYAEINLRTLCDLLRYRQPHGGAERQIYRVGGAAYERRWQRVSKARPPMGWERAKNCFPVPNELLQLNLPAGAVAVYIYLLCHADRRTNRCHPSEATMAKVLHLSRNTVAKHVRLLEEYGLIITERTQVEMKNGIRKNGNLRYTIVPMHDVLEQRYQRQMAELERQQVQQKLAAQVAEAPCSPS